MASAENLYERESMNTAGVAWCYIYISISMSTQNLYYAVAFEVQIIRMRGFSGPVFAQGFC
jgi:hypothetical protein